MSTRAGYVTNSRRPRRCEVKRLRLRDGGGKSHNRRPAWFERVAFAPDGFTLRNVRVGA